MSDVSVYEKMNALHLQALRRDVELVAIRLDRRSHNELIRNERARYDIGISQKSGKTTWRDMEIVVEHLYSPIPLCPSDMSIAVEIVEPFPTIISLEATLRANGRTVYFDDQSSDPRILATAKFYAAAPEPQTP